jgi:hypothetical protein
MHALQKIDDELTFFGCGVFDFAFVAKLVYWIEMSAYVSVHGIIPCACWAAVRRSVIPTPSV